MGVFLGIYTRITASNCFFVSSNKITIFCEIQVFCNFLRNIFHQIFLLKAFHSFIIENYKSLYFLGKYFFVLQT